MFRVQDFGLNRSAPGNQADLVDGILPCSANFAPINCATGRLNVSSNWNLSGFSAYRAAGKEVNVQLSGGAACCKSPSDCTILANKEALAQDVLQLALLYNLSGYTQCATRCSHSSALETLLVCHLKRCRGRDWEFGAPFHWAVSHSH